VKIHPAVPASKLPLANNKGRVTVSFASELVIEPKVLLAAAE